MTQEADLHDVLLRLNPQTHWVNKCPPAQGSAFDPRLASQKAAAIRQHSTSATKTTLRKPLNYFVYLDVGLWAGSSYNFGIICGRNVWLCDFTYKTRHRSVPKAAWWPNKEKAPKALKSFEQSFSDGKHGFKVKTYAHVRGEYPPSSDRVYVVLPDMHLSGARADLPCCRKGMPTYYDIMKDLVGPAFFDKVHIRVDPDTRARPWTFLQKKEADIFGSAGEALGAFLMEVVWCNLVKTGNLKVVQVGDLFELWQGMDEWSTYFDTDKSGALKFEADTEIVEVKVSHGPESRVYELFRQRPIDALSHRVQGILLQHWKIFSWLDELDKNGNIEYLYGNHDVYLIDKLRNSNDEWRGLLGNLPSCKAYLYESHVSFEHGHRMDSFNQDGEWLGPFLTELVYVIPCLRKLDPDRREQYHRLSAADVYYHNFFLNKPISVFVMGHTHVPQLVYVRFWKRPKEPGDSVCRTCKA